MVPSSSRSIFSILVSSLDMRFIVQFMRDFCVVPTFLARYINELICAIIFSCAHLCSLSFSARQRVCSRLFWTLRGQEVGIGVHLSHLIVLLMYKETSIWKLMRNFSDDRISFRTCGTVVSMILFMIILDSAISSSVLLIWFVAWSSNLSFSSFFNSSFLVAVVRKFFYGFGRLTHGLSWVSKLP